MRNFNKQQPLPSATWKPKTHSINKSNSSLTSSLTSFSLNHSTNNQRSSFTPIKETNSLSNKLKDGIDEIISTISFLNNKSSELEKKNEELMKRIESVDETENKLNELFERMKHFEKYQIKQQKIIDYLTIQIEGSKWKLQMNLNERENWVNEDKQRIDRILKDMNMLEQEITNKEMETRKRKVLAEKYIEEQKKIVSNKITNNEIQLNQNEMKNSNGVNSNGNDLNETKEMNEKEIIEIESIWNDMEDRHKEVEYQIDTNLNITDKRIKNILKDEIYCELVEESKNCIDLMKEEQQNQIKKEGIYEKIQHVENEIKNIDELNINSIRNEIKKEIDETMKNEIKKMTEIIEEKTASIQFTQSNLILNSITNEYEEEIFQQNEEIKRIEYQQNDLIQQIEKLKQNNQEIEEKTNKLSLSITELQSNPMIVCHSINEMNQINRTDYNLTEAEMKQLEDWCELKCSDILFDSQIDDWKQHTSVFNSLLLGKKQLMFVIEEEEGEKFGFYLSTQMVESYTKEIQTDRKSFHFNLISNGRLRQPMKFQLRNISCGIWLFGNSDELLITIGDIVLSKQNRKNECWYYQSNDNFHNHGIENAVCGKRGLNNPFNPKRIIVIQMK